MARSRGFQPRLTRSPRKDRAWALGPEAVSVTASNSSSLLWTNGVITSLAKVTIARIRGHGRIILSAAAAINDGFAGALGIGVVAQNAFAAGIASLPIPVTDSDWDGWMWHNFFDIRAISATIADGVNSVSTVFDFDIDTKAMRKLGDEQVVFGAIEFTETGTSTLFFSADSRMLVLL